MLNILVCAQEQEINFFKNYTAFTNESTAYFDAVESFMAYAKTMLPNVDAVIIDTKIGECSGISVAEELIGLSASISIIFLSEFSDPYLQNAFLCNMGHKPFGLMIKPLQPDVVNAYAEQLIRKKIDDSMGFRVIKTTDGLVKFDLNEILYIYCLSRYTFICTERGELYKTQFTISRLESVINSPCFSRCHKSYYINLNKIKEFNHKFIKMKDNHVIFLSRHRHKEMQSVVYEYWNYTNFA
ncbi:MAG: LytTR family DNA-binding domain-containing protein [Oscillospiraceae bacterium]